VSVETDLQWANWTIQTFEERGLADLVDLRLTEVVGAAYAHIIHSSGRLFDIITVDGGYRLECLHAASHAVKNDGVIVIDNADRVDLTSFLATWSPRLMESFDSGINRTSFYRGIP
jgi:hypothetical protein